MVYKTSQTSFNGQVRSKGNENKRKEYLKKYFTTGEINSFTEAIINFKDKMPSKDELKINFSTNLATLDKDYTPFLDKILDSTRLNIPKILGEDLGIYKSFKIEYKPGDNSEKMGLQKNKFECFKINDITSFISELINTYYQLSDGESIESSHPSYYKKIVLKNLQEELKKDNKVILTGLNAHNIFMKYVDKYFSAEDIKYFTEKIVEFKQKMPTTDYLTIEPTYSSGDTLREVRDKFNGIEPPNCEYFNFIKAYSYDYFEVKYNPGSHSKKLGLKKDEQDLCRLNDVSSFISSLIDRSNNATNFIMDGEIPDETLEKRALAKNCESEFNKLPLMTRISNFIKNKIK